MVRMPAEGLDKVVEPPQRYAFKTAVESPDESLANFFARPARIYTVTVTGSGQTAAQDYPVYTGTSSLFQKWRHLPAVSNKLAGYGLFHGHPKVTVSFTGSPLVTGTYQFSFCPLATRTTDSSLAPYLPAWFTTAGYATLRNQLPHLWIAAEEMRSYELDLPFPLASPAMDLLSNYGGDWADYGDLMTFFRRNDGLTLTPMTLEVYVSYHDVKLMEPLVIQGNTEGPWLSSRLEYASSMLHTVSTAFPFVTPWAAITGALGKFAGAMGFARPIQVAMETHRIEAPGNVSFVSGAPFFGAKVASDPAQATDVSGAFIPMTVPGDTTLASVCARPGMFYRNSALPTPGAPLVLVVAPNVASSITGIVTPGGGGYMQTPLGFCAALFEQHSGDLAVDLEFETNSLVRCRYAVLVIPPNVAAPTAYNGTASFKTTLVDVVGRTRVTIDVPYQRAKHWWVHGGPESATLNDTTVARLAIFALDALATATVGLFAWIRAGDNFKLAVFTEQRLRGYCLNPPPPVAIAVRGELPVEGEVEVHGCNDDATLPLACFGTNYTDLVALTRRPSYAFTLAGTGTRNVVSIDPLNLSSWDGILSADLIVVQQSVSVPEWVKSAYLGFSGGIRVTIMNQTVPLVDVRQTSAMGYSTATLPGTLPLYSNFVYKPAATAGMLELETRIDEPRPFRSGITNIPLNTIFTVPVVRTYGITDGQFLISGADDFVCHGYLAAPPVYLR